MVDAIVGWGPAIIGVLWLATAVGQAIYTIAYCRWGRRLHSDDGMQGDWPPVSVVMAVRGVDDRLAEGLWALTQLDYPSYTVHIAVDHPDDPAAAIVAQHVAHHPKICQMYIAEAPQTSAGLKCDRLIQLLGQLPEAAHYVAFIDADVVPDEQWLRRLVAPLRAGSVGIASGNRWYIPATWGVAETVRVMWNAAAIVQMEWYLIPWGGSMAMRRECIELYALPMEWSRTFCEDTVLARLARQRGHRVSHVPDVIAIERGTTDWAHLGNWHARQLLAVRLHHWSWPLVVVHALNGFVLSLLTLVLIAGLLCFAEQRALAILIGSYLFYSIVSIGLLQAVACRHNRPFSLGYLAWCWLLLPVVQMFHAWGVLRSMGLHRIQWSQIDYRVSAHGVERVGYSVYRSEVGSEKRG